MKEETCRSPAGLGGVGDPRRAEATVAIEATLTSTPKPIESMQLIEYNQQRFKAEACVITQGRKIRPDRTLLGLFSGVRVCGIYVFVKTENKWKLLGFLNNMDPRNYEYTPSWLKEIIGEIPQK